MIRLHLLLAKILLALCSQVKSLHTTLDPYNAEIACRVLDLGNQIEVLTVSGEGAGSGEEEEESVPVCSVGRDASTDDVCADAAVAPMSSAHRSSRSDLSPVQVPFPIDLYSFVGLIFLSLPTHTVNVDIRL